MDSSHSENMIEKGIHYDFWLYYNTLTFLRLQLDIETFGHEKLTEDLHTWMFKLAKENMEEWYLI